MNGSFCHRSALLIAPAAIACQSVPPLPPSAGRYVVTAAPIDVGDGIRLCIAVDPDDQQGIWSWTPGETGCASRSSGPAPFHPEGASVSRKPPGSMSIGFRLGTHSSSRPFIDVRLIVEEDTMRSVETQDGVPVQRRRDLDVPMLPIRGR